MTPFFNARTKRSTALTMLLVWMFALAAGAANACLLEAHATHHYASHAAHTGATEAAPGIFDRHSEGTASHDDDSDVAMADCLEVCEDGSQSLPKQPSSVDLTDPGLAPFVAVVWAAACSIATSWSMGTRG